MARIPQKFIDDLLDRVDIVEIIDRRVKLRKTGKNYAACCPFHDEKTPSFSVNPEKQFFYCFGCGVGGNALGFLMDFERIDFPEAVANLAQSAGLEVPKEESSNAGPGQYHDNHRPLYEQLEKAAIFYEQALRKHPEAPKAVSYLKNRGLTGQIAKAFRLGFAPPGWDNLLGALGMDENQQALLNKAGMLVTNDKGRTYDRFRDRIIFPILDARGRVIAFGGRVLGDDKPKYLNSPETPVFQKSRELYGLYQARKANRSLNRIVVVEGYMDVIALAQHGIHYAVATLGTATSEHHLERLYRHVSEVVFCFDGDNAGRKAAFRGLEAALPVMQDGRQARFLFLPEGEDPDSLVRAKGQAHLEHLLANAAPLEQFLFDQLAEDIDLTNLDGRARFSKIAAPYLKRLPQGVFRTLMFQALAERTGIDVDSLLRLQAPPPEPSPMITQHPTNSRFSDEQASMPVDYYDELLSQSEAEDTYTEDAILSTVSLAGSDNSLVPNHIDPMHRILGLLVLKPDLGRQLDSTLMPNNERRDQQLFHDLVAHIEAHQDMSTAALLGFWHGTPEGQLLAELAGREPLEDERGQQALFFALLEQQARERQLMQLRERLNALKATPYANLSPEEKQELLTLTTEIRALSGRR